jgi:hypothetical protein
LEAVVPKEMWRAGEESTGGGEVGEKSEKHHFPQLIPTHITFHN